MKVYDVYLEPLEERYTSQWARWFPEEFKKSGIDYEKIEGLSLTSTIQSGKFLDIDSTIHWKAEQIKNISKLFYKKKINDGDIFFIPDMWFPIEQIKYMADLHNIKIKIYSFLHAGSYTNEDFAEKLTPWAKYLEVSWAKMCDGIFVGTNYHKNAFINRRIKPYSTSKDYEEISSKIFVTGNPFNSKEILDVAGPINNKSDIIIFPNRFDYEKRPNLFLDIAQILKSRHHNWTFLVTTSSPTFRCSHKWLNEYANVLVKNSTILIKSGISKSDYYKYLASSKVMVSTTIEEMFGYCTVEAMSLNTKPIVPNKYSHPELVPTNKYLYDDLDDCINKIEEAMGSKTENLIPYAKRFDNSINTMINIMCR